MNLQELANRIWLARTLKEVSEVRELVREWLTTHPNHSLYGELEYLKILQEALESRSSTKRGG